MAIKIIGPIVGAIGERSSIPLRKAPVGTANVTAWLCVSQSMLRHPSFAVDFHWEWSLTANGIPTGDGAGGTQFRTITDGVPVCRQGQDPGVLDIEQDVEFTLENAGVNESAGIETVSSGPDNIGVSDVWIRPVVTPRGGSSQGVEYAVVLQAFDVNGDAIPWQ